MRIHLLGKIQSDKKGALSTLLVVLIAIMSSPTRSEAGAWTLKQHAKQYITSLLYYSTDTHYNQDSKREKLETFRKFEASVLGEYGLTDVLTFGGKLNLQHAHQQQPTSSNSPDNLLVGDADIFIRQQLWSNDQWVLSVQPLLKVPSAYAGNDVNGISNNQGAGELRGLIGHSFKAFDQYHFTNLEVAYRTYLGGTTGAIDIDATLGIRPTEKLLLMSQLSTSFNSKGFYIDSFLSENDPRYDLVKLQLSAVHKVNDTLSIQYGAFHHITGTNTGGGSGVIFSVWRSF